MNFAKFLRTPFLTEHFQWLLLNVIDSTIDFQKAEVATCVLERLKDSEYMTIKNVV